MNEKLTTTYKLGKLPFRLLEENEFSSFVRDELMPVQVGDIAEDILEYQFCPRSSLKHLDNATLLPPFEIAKQAIRGNAARLEFLIRNQGRQLTVQAAHGSSGIGKRERLPLAAQRFLNWNYLAINEEVAKDFMYNLFDFTTQIAQLPLGQTHIHASAIERNGKAVVVAGWGGIGKTTTMLKLIAEDGWKYLSDDLGVLDVDGMVYRSPKRMQIYAYNLEDEHVVADKLLASRSQVDRLSWSYFKRRKGIKGVRRRVSAEGLFGAQGSGSKAAIERMLLIERSTGNQFERCDLTRQEFAKRAAATLLSEIDPYTRVAAAAQSSGMESCIPSTGELFENTRAVLEKAVTTVVPTQIRIPLHAGPKELADFMRQELQELY